MVKKMSDVKSHEVIGSKSRSGTGFFVKCQASDIWPEVDSRLESFFIGNGLLMSDGCYDVISSASGYSPANDILKAIDSEINFSYKDDNIGKFEFLGKILNILHDGIIVDDNGNKFSVGDFVKQVYGVDVEKIVLNYSKKVVEESKGLSHVICGYQARYPTKKVLPQVNQVRDNRSEDIVSIGRYGKFGINMSNVREEKKQNKVELSLDEKIKSVAGMGLTFMI
ncbi:MAG: hypothetical protein LBC92_01925 [Rickettsiales bacterium]|jgi:hypothetical protein|nr:hypothetical protein [Rickettsiales bacterium]